LDCTRLNDFAKKSMILRIRDTCILKIMTTTHDSGTDKSSTLPEVKMSSAPSRETAWERAVSVLLLTLCLVAPTRAADDATSVEIPADRLYGTVTDARTPGAAYAEVMRGGGGILFSINSFRVK
jgi:hypothetical protein